MRRGHPILLLAALGALVVAVVACGGDQTTRTAGDRPNIVLIVTDDQMAFEYDLMPRTQALLADQGVTFVNGLAPYPLCCPARATLFSGQFAHNHGVRDNVWPGGGFRKFDGSEQLGVWLQAEGYRTAMIGKQLNGYGDPSQDPPDTDPLTPEELVWPGWDNWFALVDPWTLNYWNYVVNDNGEFVNFGEELDDYQTDVLANRVVDDIRAFADDGDPFFISFWPLAPHSGRGSTRPTELSPAPHPRHLDEFSGLTAPRTPAFLSTTSGRSPAMDAARTKLAAALVERNLDEQGWVDYIDTTVQARAQSLLAVDEAVERIVETLAETGQLDNTYLLFVSDNGWTLGEHGLALIKVVPYENSIRTPILLRGPGLPVGEVRTQLASHADVPATIVSIAGATPGLQLDGISLLGLVGDPSAAADRVIPIESSTEDEPYRGVRTPEFVFFEWRDGSGVAELYDLVADPYQLENLVGDPRYARAEARLREAVVELEDCAGQTCQLVIPAADLRA